MSELKAGVIHTPHDEGMTFVTDSDTIRVNERETKFYIKSEADKVIAELEENHKNEVEQLRMKIAGLEKLVETANKLIKQKNGFTIKDVTFGGVKLEGINTHKNEEAK